MLLCAPHFRSKPSSSHHTSAHLSWRITGDRGVTLGASGHQPLSDSGSCPSSIGCQLWARECHVGPVTRSPHCNLWDSPTSRWSWSVPLCLPAMSSSSGPQISEHRTPEDSGGSLSLQFSENLVSVSPTDVSPLGQSRPTLQGSGAAWAMQAFPVRQWAAGSQERLLLPGSWDWSSSYGRHRIVEGLWFKVCRAARAPCKACRSWGCSSRTLPDFGVLGL